MKILTNKEKKAKKHQYKMENPDIFFTREEYEIYEYKYYNKKDERMFVPEYFKKKIFSNLKKESTDIFIIFTDLLQNKNF